MRGRTHPRWHLILLLQRPLSVQVKASMVWKRPVSTWSGKARQKKQGLRLKPMPEEAEKAFTRSAWQPQTSQEEDTPAKEPRWLSGPTVAKSQRRPTQLTVRLPATAPHMHLKTQLPSTNSIAQRLQQLKGEARNAGCQPAGCGMRTFRALKQELKSPLKRFTTVKPQEHPSLFPKPNFLQHTVS